MTTTPKPITFMLDGQEVEAREGETILALDGKTYTLDPSVAVIADSKAPHGIGGVMGGENTGVQEDTTEVFLEVAYFTPMNVASTGRKLGIRSASRAISSTRAARPWETRRIVRASARAAPVRRSSCWTSSARKASTSSSHEPSHGMARRQPGSLPPANPISSP